MNIIDVNDVRGLVGHDYFRGSPATSSDLVLVLTGAGRPGTPRRPLEHVQSNFWRLPPGYPR